MVLKERTRLASREDFLKASRRVIGKSVIVSRVNAVYVHASQPSVIIITGIIDVLGNGNAIYVYLLLVLREASGVIIRASHVGNKVGPRIAGSICGQGKMVGIVVVEYTPFAISREPIPPFPSFTIAIVVREILDLAGYSGPAL